MKIVITDHRFPNVEQEQRAVAAAGGELVVGQASQETELIELCREADAVLTARAPITRGVIEAMRRCRVIVRYGIGVDTVDIDAATERGILVANVPDYCIDEVSDHALTLLLMLSRQAVPSIALARREQWTLAGMPTLHRLRGQTAGLFGAGRIGLLLAGKVAALGLSVLACDPFLDDAAARRSGLEKVDFAQLLARSDFISLHAPLNEQTRHVFNAQALARMKPTAYLINTARGGLIDEKALLAALDAGQIAGAGLDVLESEAEVTPLRSALVNHPKVIVTAHTAWLSAEARAALQRSAIEQALACLRGELPYALVNRQAAGGRRVPAG